MTDTEPFILYAETRDRLLDMVRRLGAERAAVAVPLTPGWTVTEVVAHLCGLNADVAAGMREGMGSDERTAHQVGTRAGRTIEELAEEWLGLGPAMEQAMAEDGFFGRRLTADLVVHLHDVSHALGVAIDTEDEVTISGGRTYALRTPDRLLELTGMPVVIELADGLRFEPSTGGASVETALLLRATAYDFLRSVTGRRSRSQVEVLDWSGDPTPVLDRFSPYGPPRVTDAEI